MGLGCLVFLDYPPPAIVVVVAVVVVRPVVAWVGPGILLPLFDSSPSFLLPTGRSHLHLRRQAGPGRLSLASFISALSSTEDHLPPKAGSSNLQPRPVLVPFPPWD